MSGRVSYLGGIVKDGLVLDLDAGKLDSYNRLGTTWNDISGNRNNGTLFGVPTFDSNNNGSIYFNGSSQVGTIPYNSSIPSGTAARTICCWFKWMANSYTAPGHEIFGMGANVATGSRLALWIDQPNASIGIEIQGFGKVIGTWSGRNTWVHLCVTMPLNGTLATMPLYYNGTFVSSPIYLGSSAAAPNNPATEIKIGGIPTVPTGYLFDGNISQILIYNRQLSASEVLQNYNATKGRYI